ncbi:hypothetical protein L596_011596 [Steinernema carpocapsae]|uniref:Uncharacterized protein n=1 Tax=Steinernema carpocapsae TaxID=34508 RepID=A0A4U5NVA1_STECR|nr:hypothetical protein L596_011596 [Steinernema carpocapsae]
MHPDDPICPNAGRRFEVQNNKRGRPDWTTLTRRRTAGVPGIARGRQRSCICRESPKDAGFAWNRAICSALQTPKVEFNRLRDEQHDLPNSSSSSRLPKFKCLQYPWLMQRSSSKSIFSNLSRSNKFNPGEHSPPRLFLESFNSPLDKPVLSYTVLRFTTSVNNIREQVLDWKNT